PAAALAVFALVSAAGFALVLASSRRLNLSALGEAAARERGVDALGLKRAVFGGAALLVSAVVAFAGPIGFVGLIVPHALRMLLGPDNRVLVPAAALGGAIFLLVGDTLARSIVAPAELSVGVLTAFCGAPFFVFLLRARAPRVLSGAACWRSGTWDSRIQRPAAPRVRHSRCARSASPWRRGRSSASSAPTRPARPPCSSCSRFCSPPRGAVPAPTEGRCPASRAPRSPRGSAWSPRRCPRTFPTRSRSWSSWAAFLTRPDASSSRTRTARSPVRPCAPPAWRPSARRPATGSRAGSDHASCW